MDYSNTEADHPDYYLNPLNYVAYFFEHFGWYVVLLALIILYIHGKLTPYLDEYERKKEIYLAAKRGQNQGIKEKPMSRLLSKSEQDKM